MDGRPDGRSARRTARQSLKPKSTALFRCAKHLHDRVCPFICSSRSVGPCGMPPLRRVRGASYGQDWLCYWLRMLKNDLLMIRILLLILFVLVSNFTESVKKDGNGGSYMYMTATATANGEIVLREMMEATERHDDCKRSGNQKKKAWQSQWRGNDVTVSIAAM